MVTDTQNLTAGESRERTARVTRTLLACGAVAGLLLPALALIQAVTREGFDLRRHYLSQLSTGDLGWIQMANFVVTGLLYIAFAVGVWRVLHPGRAGTWGPLLIGAYGICLLIAGVFVTDPANGFPRGTPDGVPSQISWHSVVHGIAAVVSFLFLIAACFVFARRFAALRQRGWMAYSIASGLVCFVLPWAPSAWPGVTLFAGGVVGWAWVVAIAVRLMQERRLIPDPSQRDESTEGQRRRADQRA
jgi:hypothetical protein